MINEAEDVRAQREGFRSDGFPERPYGRFDPEYRSLAHELSLLAIRPELKTRRPMLWSVRHGIHTVPGVTAKSLEYTNEARFLTPTSQSKKL
jgi:hypothetical protein